MDPLDRRGDPLPVRFRAGELALVQQRAAEANCPVSTFIREQALHGRIIVRQHQTLSPIDRHDLARFGNNLNQVTRVINQTGDITLVPRVDLVLDKLEATLADIRSILERFDGRGGPPDELGQR